MVSALGQNRSADLEQGSALDADRALAKRCVAGVRAAEIELFESYRLKVHATLYRILGSNREMEDLVQNAFSAIYESLPRYRAEARLGTWIDRITSRVAYDFLREKRRSIVHLGTVPDIPDHGASTESTALAREALRRLYRVLEHIEAGQRVAFALHVIDGRPLREVAIVTGASLVATKMRVWRARREIWRRAARDPVLSGFLTRELGEAS